jgi:sec-independent protein translocase protein TatB
MFSITPSEIATIAIVALIVIGPRRLPGVARRAGQLTRQLRGAGEDFKSDLGTDYEESIAPFREAASDLSATGKTLRESIEGQLRWVDKAVDDTAEAAKPQAEEALPPDPPAQEGAVPPEESG